MRLYGEDGFALLALLIAFWVPISNTIAVGVLASAVESSADEKAGTRLRLTPAVIFTHTLKTAASNPLIIATVSGLICNVFSVPLPATLTELLHRLGSASLALGLLCIGAGLRTHGLRESLALITANTAVKLVLLPGVAALLAYFFGITGMTAGIVILFAAMPTAQSCYVMTASMGGNAPLVAGITTAHTLVSMVTLSIWSAFLLSAFPVWE